MRVAWEIKGLRARGVSWRERILCVTGDTCVGDCWSSSSSRVLSSVGSWVVSLRAVSVTVTVTVSVSVSFSVDASVAGSGLELRVRLVRLHFCSAGEAYVSAHSLFTVRNWELMFVIRTYL